MKKTLLKNKLLFTIFLVAAAIVISAQVSDKSKEKKESSYMSVIEEPLSAVMAKDKAGKAEVMKRQRQLLNERYDTAKHVTSEVTMSRGKPIPVGPTAKLKGVSWEQLASMKPEEIKEKNIFPYLPLPHPNHPVGGMIFPQMQTDTMKRLERFDLDFDLPEHFLPEFPPAIFLTTHKEAGDVSKGQMITFTNFYDLFTMFLIIVIFLFHQVKC